PVPVVAVEMPALARLADVHHVDEASLGGQERADLVGVVPAPHVGQLRAAGGAAVGGQADGRVALVAGPGGLLGHDDDVFPQPLALGVGQHGLGVPVQRVGGL